MIASLQRNPLIAALAVVAGVLALTLVLELGLTGRTIPAEAARKGVAAEAKLLPSLAATTPEQAFPETAGRPLFTPTRRPAPEAAAPAASMERGKYVLLGVTIAGETRIAMLREKASGRIHRVEQGRDLGNVKVAKIEPEAVTLALGGESELLPLQVQRPGPVAGTPGAPGVPPTAAAPAPQALSQGPFAPVPGRAMPQPLPPGMMPPPASGMPPFQAAPGAMPVQPPTASAHDLPPSIANPSAAPMPQATTQPMTPEELLARRRARRSQQSQ